MITIWIFAMFKVSIFARFVNDDHWNSRWLIIRKSSSTFFEVLDQHGLQASRIIDTNGSLMFSATCFEQVKGMEIVCPN